MKTLSRYLVALLAAGVAAGKSFAQAATDTATQAANQTVQAVQAVQSAVGAAAAPAQPAVQTATQNSASAGSLFQMLIGFAAVLALLAGIAWVMKRMGVAGPAVSSVAKIVGGVSVGNRERVLVVEVGDQWIVVGVAPGRVNSLATMPRQERAVASTNAAPDLASAKTFATWLKQTIDKRNGNPQ